MARSRANSRRFIHPPRRPNGGRVGCPGCMQPCTSDSTSDIIAPSHDFFAVRFRVFGLGLLVWLAFLPSQAAGQVNYETGRRERHLEAVKSTAPITIDGALDEAVWRDAPIASGFIQSEPDEGEPASHETEVRVALRRAGALSSASSRTTARPAEIIVNDLKKDFDTARTDMFQVVLDTFHDERNGYHVRDQPDGRQVGRADGERGPRDQRELGRPLVRQDAHRRRRLVRRDRRFRSARCASRAATRRPGASTSMRQIRRRNEETATGRRCRGSTS